MQKSVIQKMVEDKNAINKCIREGGDLKALANERGIKFATPVNFGCDKVQGFECPYVDTAGMSIEKDCNNCEKNLKNIL